MYGAQAMFVRRGVFEALGGFPESEPEDFKLPEWLRERAASVLLPATVLTGCAALSGAGHLA